MNVDMIVKNVKYMKKIIFGSIMNDSAIMCNDVIVIR